MQRKIFLSLIVILFFQTSSYAEKLTIKFATGEYYPFTTEKTVGKGIFPEIIDEIFRRLDYKAIYEFMPWQRTEKLTEVG
jgi:hypothetical protein